ncbi:hypothetical protein DIPPA_14769 [Diplonema papillatum]|nr:hypothetical protein DIPPA_14769 [Diplonema papillatum]
MHLGLCGVHKLQTMALGMSDIDSLRNVNEKADAMFPGMDKDMKLKVLSPISVNEKVEEGELGVWSDPCADAPYKCEADRPAMVLLPGIAASPLGYTGAAASIARTANASMLVCEYTDDPLESAVACYDAARKNASTVYVVGTSVGASIALLLHKRLVATGTPSPRAYWLVSPWLQSQCAAASDEDWTRPPCTEAVRFDVALDDAQQAALPPTLVSWGGAETDAGLTKEFAAKNLPKAQTDEAAGMPHEYILFADWVHAAKASIRVAKEFFKKTV